MTTLRSAFAVMLVMTAAAQAADVPAQPMTGWADVLAMPAVQAAVASMAPADRATVDEATAGCGTRRLAVRTCAPRSSSRSFWSRTAG